MKEICGMDGKEIVDPVSNDEWKVSNVFWIFFFVDQ